MSYDAPINYDAAMIDFDALREQEPALWKAISKITGFDSGNHRVEMNKLLTAYQNALRSFVEKSGPATAAKPPQAPDNPVVGTKAEEERKAAQRRADEAAAVKRLEEWSGAPNYLLCNERNIRNTREWVVKNLGGYWSAGGVDVAIANLGPRGRNWLQWGKAPEPPRPAEPLPPQAPAEVLGTCSDGQPQLPLETAEWVLRKSTPAQIRDWQKRRMAAYPGEGIISRGFFGSRYGG